MNIFAPERKNNIAFVRLLLALLILVLVSSCGLNINANDIPRYPNALNMKEETPDPQSPIPVYTWDFLTHNTPDEVVQYYGHYLRTKYGSRVDLGVSSLSDLTYIIHSCPFYWVEIISSQINSTTYEITVQFAKELCF